MSRAWMVQLLLMPLCVILQETCSSVTCSNNPGDPGNERLGNDTTALLHFQVASTTTACVDQINTGNCNADSSCQCDPTSNPQTIGDFADTGGTLECGGQNSCQSPTSSTDGLFFSMREPRPLVCSGKTSCDKDFDVENVGSMCVTGDNAAGPSAQTGTFKLANADDNTGRYNDVCCARPFTDTTGGANNKNCANAKFENVRNFYCAGDGTCNDVRTTLSGDFYCRAKQGCGAQLNSVDEYWQWTTSGQHCIRCQSIESGTDQGSCTQSDFRFPVENSYPTVICTGFKACQEGQGQGNNADPFLTLSAGSCANIICTEGGFTGNNVPCQGMKVKLEGNAACYAGGDAITNSNYPRLYDGGNNEAACTLEEPCEFADPTCEPSFCCTTDVLDYTKVDCGPCTTSTTTSTTSTTSTTTSTTSTTSTTTSTSQSGNDPSSGTTTTSTTTSTSQSGNDPSSGTTTSTTTTTTTTSGGASGDPHIHSLYGAHYTLLREGVFVAWEFKKDLESSGKPENAVHWQLLARYGGKKFRTLGILLLDNSGHKLEFSAHDCALRAKEGDHPWYIAKPGLLLPGTASSIGLQDSRKNTTLHRTLIDARINFNITGSHGSRKVASLYTHCIRGDHLNFKITMLQKKDLVSVGGEMGVHPQALEDTTHVSFLSHSASSKLRAMRTRTDEEFQAKKPCVDLGGTAASDRFFRTFNHISFVERPNECGDEGEQEARQICGKHLPNEASNQSEVFADCIFDVCHGGGELDAELRADLMAA